MMKQVNNIKTTTFDVNMIQEPGFYVDIVETEEKYYAYLFHEEYGIKELMFGAYKNTQHIKSLQDFLDMVEANLYNQDYINGYKDDYMQY